MLRHYLVTAARSLAHHKLYTFINVAGLSIGLAAAILIVLYVRDELSYDKWVPGAANLYRLERGLPVPGHGMQHTAQVPFPVLRAVGDQISQVEAVTHVHPERMSVHVGDRLFHDTAIFVDPNFFKVIRLPLAEGDPARVLSQPESVVLSESFARKYFGRADPIGRTLNVTPDRNAVCSANDVACLNASHALKVSGVLRDLPHNTQLVADLVVPNSSQADGMSPQEKASDWLANDFVFGYVELASGTRPETVLAQIGPMLDRLVDLRKFGLTGRLSQLEADRYFLTPFRDVHLTSDQNGGMKAPGSWTTLYGLIAIALLIVLVACCNVMNLATARASLRSREIALRKLGGAKRRQIVAQFLGEAVLMALISLAIALSLVEVLLPAYARFLGEPLSLRYATDWGLIGFLITGAAAAGVLAGLYPALVLSAFRPAEALKSRGVGASGSGLLRAALVVAQFAISIGLAVAALVVLRQIDFARRVELGIDRQGVVVVRDVERMTRSERDSFAATLTRDPNIERVAYSRGVPFRLLGFFDKVQMPGRPEFDTEVLNIGPGFPSLYGMRLLAGRFLSSDRGTDVSNNGERGVRNVLINATAAERLGLSAEEAVGRRVPTLGRPDGPTIVGVLSDANLRSVRDPLEPMIFYFDPAQMAELSIRIRAEEVPRTLAYIDRTWRAFEPGASIHRYFLADDFDDYFRQVDHAGAMLGIFVGIAIFIACLGLFGLAVFTAERRTKEIGVRKITGARTTDIVGLMLWRISVPVLVANVIAWPVAYHYLRHWLDGYAYRITLSPVYFLAGGAVALVIAWTTVFAHTLHLARASPVHALRYE
ncbi:MAG: ABC transporter permease [Steroidobacteraceae bacterium]